MHTSTEGARAASGFEGTLMDCCVGHLQEQKSDTNTKKAPALFWGTAFKELVPVSVGTYADAVKKPSSVQVSMENCVEPKLTLCHCAQVGLFKYRHMPERKCWSSLSNR